MIFTSSTPLISAYSIALTLALFFLAIVSPSHHPSRPSTQGLVVEEKARLGSTPPSCQNRCNMCHPCMAVQVPTAPSRGRVDPSSVRDRSDHDSSRSNQNRYSNYKPLGWKCRCEGHLYNP